MQYASPVTGAYPRAAYGYYVTAVLMLAYTLSFVDRQILSFMVEPVKRDLILSDTAISLLHGFAFAIFYTAVGLFLGRAADRLNRKRLIIAGVATWCAATVACGFASSYGELFAARILVGVGEAALSPAAYSILSDYFPDDRRARPIGLYSAGVYLGSGFAFIAGGAVIEATSFASAVELGSLGSFRPWQLAFIIVGIPGLIMLPLMLTVREPVRRMAAAAAPDLSHFRKRASFYVPAIFGYALLAVITFAYTAWLPAAFMRVWSWTPGEIGLSYGLIMLTAGPGGMLTAGWVADRMYRSGLPDAPIRLSLYSMVFSLPAIIALAFVPTPHAALVAVAVATFLVSMSIALAPTALQNVTPNQLRGQATAIYLLVVSLIGMGGGPTFVALVTDYGFGDESRVLLSLAIVSTTAVAGAILLVAASLRPFRALLAAPPSSGDASC